MAENQPREEHGKTISVRDEPFVRNTGRTEFVKWETISDGGTRYYCLDCSFTYKTWDAIDGEQDFIDHMKEKHGI